MCLRKINFMSAFFFFCQSNILNLKDPNSHYNKLPHHHFPLLLSLLFLPLHFPSLHHCHNQIFALLNPCHLFQVLPIPCLSSRLISFLYHLTIKLISYLVSRTIFCKNQKILKGDEVAMMTELGHCYIYCLRKLDKFVIQSSSSAIMSK